MERIIKYYNGVDEYLADFSGVVVNSLLKRKYTLTNDAKERLTALRELMRGGDSANAAKIRAAGEIDAPQKESGSFIEPAMVGCLPNVPTYIQGTPKQMLRVTKRATAATKVVDIYVDVTQFLGEDMTELAKQSANICGAIAAAELAGLRINLHSVCAMRTKEGGFAGYSIKLKDAAEPLNLLNIAFCMMNEDFNKVHISWLEQHFHESMFVKKGLYYGYISYAANVEMNLEGLFIRVGGLVREHATLEDVTQIINKYVAEQS